MFSNNFIISADLVELTGTRLSITAPYKARPISKHTGVDPPITFGILRVVNTRFPGSSLSGENSKKKSSPILNPRFSIRGRMYSSVVPGKVVLSRLKTWPGFRYGSKDSIVFNINDKSGSRCAFRGVGTHNIKASISELLEKSVVQYKNPLSISSDMDSSLMCLK